TFPAEGENSGAMYQVDDGAGPGSDIDLIRLVVKDSDRRDLFAATNKMSNWYLPATVVHNGVVFHDVELRLTGSRWIRPNSGYKVRFNPEQPLLGVHDSVRYDLNGMTEIVMKQMLNRAGTKSSSYDDIGYLVSPNRSHTHEVLVNLARYENIYLDEQFGDSSGTKFELDDVTIPTGSGVESLKNNTDVYQDADIGVNTSMVQSQGANPEFYRAHLLIKSSRTKDDFPAIVRMAQAIHQTDEMDLFEATNAVMDVDEWMRHYANQAYFGNWDTYGFRRPKNLRMYQNPADEKMVPLMWDCDLCGFNETIYNARESRSRLDEIRDIPHNFRLFWGHMYDYIDRSFNEEYVARWVTHYGEKTNNATHGGDSGLTFATFTRVTGNRSRQALAEIERRVPKVDFAITTNGGNDMVVDTNSVQLQGKGWVNVRQLRLAGSEVPLDAFWPENDVWQVELPLGNNANEISIEAYDFRGNLIDTKSISVTTTQNNPAIDSLRITEINYNPGNPTDQESAAGHDDADDFEFIEFRNTGDQTISLAGIELAEVQVNGNPEGVAFDFTNGAITELAPGAFVLVVEDMEAFAMRYGNDLPVAGQWSGGLSNGSETITVRAEGAAIQQFSYNDNWHPSTDGDGNTLEIINEKGALEAWGTAEGWRPSAIANGSPGAEGSGRVPGDSNGDGIFDSSDFVLVFQAGEYEDGIAGNSTFEEGDWDGDGDFTSSDFVFVFTVGNYVAEATPTVQTTTTVDELVKRRVELGIQPIIVEKASRSIDGALVDDAFEDLDDDDDFELLV
ncbi:MAG: lamin tail domain-containing protein, partial [Planctomycetales bacterium]|nr:lamin tail domain-containing protein [Planctomycetales bacterium]